jgi:nondiscriminating glutamyl-tRNA synthetase
LQPAEIEQNLAAGKPFAVRLKIADHPLRFHDLVRGEVEFAAETVSDPVLVRSVAGGAAGLSSGVPVYNYVVTVDDALMQITHVIRGDDHISNTPKQVAIYEAFGWPVPEFAHLSTILGADRERLSKRHGATSISTFREMGYLPEALVNYLALLGWGAEDGKTETFTLDELTRAFSLGARDAEPGHLRLRQAQLAQPALPQAGRSRTHRGIGPGTVLPAPAGYISAVDFCRIAGIGGKGCAG